MWVWAVPCAGAFDVYSWKGNASVSEKAACSSSCTEHEHDRVMKGFSLVIWIL